MTINSPSGKRSAVGVSMIPGNPKLPVVTRCQLLAAKLGKHKNVPTTVNEITLL